MTRRHWLTRLGLLRCAGLNKENLQAIVELILVAESKNCAFGELHSAVALSRPSLPAIRKAMSYACARARRLACCLAGPHCSLAGPAHAWPSAGQARACAC